MFYVSVVAHSPPVYVMNQECRLTSGSRTMNRAGRVHALIEPANVDTPPALEELDAHLRLHLASYKLPRGYEIVAMLPRDEAGKIRRSKLREERGG